MSLYDVIDEFIEITKSDRNMLKIEVLKSPHKSGDLPNGKQAIYIFEKDGIFFKIGKVGSKSNNRFRYQHYNSSSAKSNLAKSILNNKENMILKQLFDLEKVNLLSSENISSFIRENLNRINIYMDSSLGEFYLNLLEALLHYRLNPIFEGKKE